MKRICSNCSLNGVQREAHFVAGDAQGLQWFECGEHGPRDNIAAVERTKLQSIREWYAELGLDFDHLQELDELAPVTERATAQDNQK